MANVACDNDASLKVAAYYSVAVAKVDVGYLHGPYEALLGRVVRNEP